MPYGYATNAALTSRASSGSGSFNMSSVGRGGFGSGGAAGGAAAGAMFGPWGAVIGAIVGAGLGIAGARSNNKAVKKQANIAFERIGDFITQGRVDQIRNTEQLARDAMISLGAVTNVSPESQSAIETIASRLVRSVASDQFAINEEASRREVAGLAQMESVKDQANSQMQSPVTAAFLGGSTGASAGAQMGGAIDDWSRMEAIQTQSDQAHGVNMQLANLQLTRATAESDSAKMARTFYARGLAMQAAQNFSTDNPYARMALKMILPPLPGVLDMTRLWNK